MYRISEASIPTESRPGHVAMVSGFGEDVSSVMKGWRANPVAFDTIFNQSASTWAWGSPDIMSLFSQAKNFNSFEYPADFQDFSADNADFLDTWVLENFRKFMTDSRSNRNMEKNGTIFFLHLLGSDTNGHSHKPSSEQYKNNVQERILKY